MQEIYEHAANQQKRMEQFFLMTSRRCRRSLLAVLTAPLLFCGCGSQTDAERLAGHWHGTNTTGSVSASSDWQFNRDGTDTASLSLPQGAMTVQGIWSLHAGTLTQYANSRSIIVGGQQKKISLLNPMETTYQCALTGDALTLTRPEAHETITLTRETENSK